MTDTPIVTATPIGPGEIPPPGLDDVRLVNQGRIEYGDMIGAAGGPVDEAGLTFCLPYLSDCRAVRVLADGRLAAVRPLLFGGQLCVGDPGRLAGPMGAWDDVWDYATCLQAVLEAGLCVVVQDGGVKFRTTAKGDREVEALIKEAQP